MTQELWLTKREVAAELRCSVRTVERLRLPSMRVGGMNRYRMSQVYAALNGTESAGENVVALRPRAREKVA